MDKLQKLTIEREKIREMERNLTQLIKEERRLSVKEKRENNRRVVSFESYERLRDENIQLRGLFSILKKAEKITYNNLGVILMEQGRYREAIECFEEAIANSGRMFEACVNLGYIYFKLGELEKVVEVNEKAVEIEPRYARGHANIGFAYLQMARPDEAIKALERAIEINPEIAQAWSNLINAYLQKDDIEKAVETGEKLVEFAPDFALGQNNLAYAYYLKENYEKAVKHLDKAMELGFQAHPEFVSRLAPYRVE